MAIGNLFGAVLREARSSKKLSQQQLALDADIDRTYISLLERGLRQPTLEMIFRIAGALDLAPTELVRRVEARVGEAQTSEVVDQLGAVQQHGGSDKGSD